MATGGPTRESISELNDKAARYLADLLRERGGRIVFAESCTAGLVAATLARIPGISEHLCGSAVVYRNATKARWLGVSPADLDDPHITAVSPQVAEAMVSGVLKNTPEAHLAVSVTGYLGPDAAAEMDGVVYVAVAVRERTGEIRHGPVRRVTLTKDASRVERQAEAVSAVFQMAVMILENSEEF